MTLLLLLLLFLLFFFLICLLLIVFILSSLFSFLLLFLWFVVFLLFFFLLSFILLFFFPICLSAIFLFFHRISQEFIYLFYFRSFLMWDSEPDGYKFEPWGNHMLFFNTPLLKNSPHVPVQMHSNLYPKTIAWHSPWYIHIQPKVFIFSLANKSIIFPYLHGVDAGCVMKIFHAWRRCINLLTSAPLIIKG